jgi:hypothetical protein
VSDAKSTNLSSSTIFVLSSTKSLLRNLAGVPPCKHGNNGILQINQGAIIKDFYPYLTGKNVRLKVYLVFKIIIILYFNEANVHYWFPCSFMGILSMTNKNKLE